MAPNRQGRFDVQGDRRNGFLAADRPALRNATRRMPRGRRDGDGRQLSAVEGEHRRAHAVDESRAQRIEPLAATENAGLGRSGKLADAASSVVRQAAPIRRALSHPIEKETPHLRPHGSRQARKVQGCGMTGEDRSRGFAHDCTLQHGAARVAARRAASVRHRDAGQAPRRRPAPIRRRPTARRLSTCRQPSNVRIFPNVNDGTPVAEPGPAGRPPGSRCRASS